MTSVLKISKREGHMKMDCNDITTNQGDCHASASGRGKEWGLRGSTALPMSWRHLSGLQNCGRMYFCCKSPSVRSFVTAALGSRYTGLHSGLGAGLSFIFQTWVLCSLWRLPWQALPALPWSGFLSGSHTSLVSPTALVSSSGDTQLSMVSSSAQVPSTWRVLQGLSARTTRPHPEVWLTSWDLASHFSHLPPLYLITWVLKWE